MYPKSCIVHSHKVVSTRNLSATPMILYVYIYNVSKVRNQNKAQTSPCLFGIICGTRLAYQCACAFAREDVRERRRPLRACARSICVRLRHSLRLQSVAKFSRPPGACLPPRTVILISSSSRGRQVREPWLPSRRVNLQTIYFFAVHRLLYLMWCCCQATSYSIMKVLRLYLTLSVKQMMLMIYKK